MIILLFLLALTPASPASNETWVRLPSASSLDPPRAGARAVSFRHRDFLLGGSNASSLYELDARGGGAFSGWVAATEAGGAPSWALQPPPAWAPRGGFAAVGSASLLLLTGGFAPPADGAGAGAAPLLGDTWAYADGAPDWELRSGANASRANSTLWAPRHGHALVLLDSSVWLVGGFAGTNVGAAVAVSDTWRSGVTGTIGGSSWRAIATGGSLPPRGFFASASFDGRLWVAGGFDGNETLFADLLFLALSGTSWAWHAVDVTGGGGGSVPWAARAGAALFVWQSVLWLVGGQLTAPRISEDGAQRLGCDMWRSDEEGLQWELVEERRPGIWGPLAHPAFLHYVAGGADVMLLLGGLAPGGGGAPAAPTGSAWASTRNLLCEDAGIVCSAHGVCSPLSSVDATSVVLPSREGGLLLGAPLQQLHAVPPLPVNCSCDRGYAGLRCGEPSCSNATCVHGVCETSPGSGASPDLCVCTDPALWVGPACATAVCATGCVHGACPGAPGTCSCAPGWLGTLCAQQDSTYRRTTVFINSNAEPLFGGVAGAGLALALGAAALLNSRAVHQQHVHHHRLSADGRKGSWGVLGVALGARSKGAAQGESTPLLRVPPSAFGAPAPAPDAPFAQRFPSRHGGAVALAFAPAPEGGGGGAGGASALTSAAGERRRGEGGGVAGAGALATRQRGGAASGAAPPAKRSVRFSERLERFQGDDVEG